MDYMGNSFLCYQSFIYSPTDALISELSEKKY